jgi:hypothetical protein
LTSSKGAAFADPGIVEHDIKPFARICPKGGQGGLPLRGIAYVQLIRGALPLGQHRSGICHALTIDIGQPNEPALVRKMHGDRPANTRRATGNENRLACDHFTSPLFPCMD